MTRTATLWLQAKVGSFHGSGFHVPAEVDMSRDLSFPQSEFPQAPGFSCRGTGGAYQRQPQLIGFVAARKEEQKL
jgi:hypothetical protein